VDDRKACTRCGEVKPLGEFTKDKSNRATGRRLMCKACEKTLRAARYAQRVTRGEVPEFGSKTCRRCGTLKPFREFYENKNTSDGRGSYCKSCMAQWQRDYKGSLDPDARRARVRRSNLQAKYGITVDDYAALLQIQGQKCAICSRRWTATVEFHIDHDHVSGAIRGILCGTCNRALGMFGDSIAAIERVLAYLKDPPATLG